MLFAGLGSVRIVKNSDLRLEDYTSRNRQITDIYFISKKYGKPLNLEKVHYPPCTLTNIDRFRDSRASSMNELQ